MVEAEWSSEPAASWLGLPRLMVSRKVVGSGGRCFSTSARLSGWAQLDEAGCCEVAIEGQRLTDFSSPHYDEARRIDKRVLSLVTRAQPLEGFRLHLLVNVHDSHVRELLETVEEAHCGGVA